MSKQQTLSATTHRTIGLIVLNSAAVLIVVGGCYDIFLSQLPAHLNNYLGVVVDGLDVQFERLVLALLHALGGGLVAVGLAALVLINWPIRRHERWASATVLIMVILAEGANAWGMWIVDAPWWAPLTMIGLTLVGIVLVNPYGVWRHRSPTWHIFDIKNDG